MNKKYSMYSKFISLCLIKVSKPIFSSKYNRRTVSFVIAIVILNYLVQNFKNPMAIYFPCNHFVHRIFFVICIMKILKIATCTFTYYIREICCILHTNTCHVHVIAEKYLHAYYTYINKCCYFT